ncbi:MAG: TIGR04255 family protein [Clostridia bacterium]|nr:TIGR04255 family protein [Clostridia bacterium]
MPKYKNNQITEMVCQLRYSTILKINNESDEDLSKFQERIQNDYPNYKAIDENVIDVKMSQAKERIDYLVPQIYRNSMKNYMFSSENETERINLTCNFISYSTTKYECWDIFKEKFIRVFNDFHTVYGVKNYNRLGIRYINGFSKEELQIDESDNWNKYLDENIVGLLSKHSDVKVYTNNIEIPFEDSIQMQITCGLGTKQLPDRSVKPVFIMDKDTYKLGNISEVDINSILEKLHAHNSEMFESLIKQELREKMGVEKND